MVIDGYSIILHFNVADYHSHLVETVQIIGKNNPFLPFNLVLKIARRFLGNSHLNITEFLKDNRKIYCWTICLDRRGRPIPNQHGRVNPLSYEGFQYNYIEQTQMRFY
jgi:hypothetical protein